MKLKKLKIEAVFSYDVEAMHFGDKAPDDKAWFLGEILLKDTLIVHSNEIGDEIGMLKIIKINK